jgi:hypothetical protein
VLIALITALSTLGVAALGFIGVRWAKSGQIKTTEAEVLWHESTAMRQALTDRITVLVGEIDRHMAENARLTQENDDLRAQLSVKGKP